MAAKTKYEKFTACEVERKNIKLAAYNPRRIDSDNRKSLEKGLKENGLVEPLVWNKRTGNLVSGHQRIALIDKMERGQDYSLTVSMIDVDEYQEKKINVQLNNKSMQGDFDGELLAQMALDSGLGLKEMGFSDFDIQMMYGGDDRFSELFEDTAEVEDTKHTIQEIKDHREKMNEKYSKEQSADFYFVVVCKDQNEKDEYMRKMCVPAYETYVTTKELRRAIED